MRKKRTEYFGVFAILFLLALLITACNRATSTSSSPTKAAEPTPTTPTSGHVSSPVDCGAEPVSTSEIRINWAVPADLSGQLGFRIYQGVESLEIELADPGLRTVVIGNLAPNTQYHFDVRAYNATTESTPDACFVDVTTLQ